MPRLLIVKTSSMGDVIHNLPILADMRANFPDMLFDWVVEEAFADIPPLHPAVGKVIPVAIRRWRRQPFAAATRDEISACRQQLQSENYDLVLDTQGLLKSAIIALNAHGIRHGQDFSSAREPLAAAFYQHRHHVPKGRHAVTRNRELAALALGYTLPDTPPDYGIRAPQCTLPDSLPENFIVGLHATSRASKLWPSSHWITLGQQFSKQGLHLVLPWGSEAEHQRARLIASYVPLSLVLPRLRLHELAAVLSKARAAVGVDTGLVHLAVALEIPTVAVYTDTDPTLTGVFPGFSPAVNLGGIGQIPEPDAVLAALQPD